MIDSVVQGIIRTLPNSAGLEARQEEKPNPQRPIVRAIKVAGQSKSVAHSLRVDPRRWRAYAAVPLHPAWFCPRSTAKDRCAKSHETVPAPGRLDRAARQSRRSKVCLAHRGGPLPSQQSLGLRPWIVPRALLGRTLQQSSGQLPEAPIQIGLPHSTGRLSDPEERRAGQSSQAVGSVVSVCENGH